MIKKEIDEEKQQDGDKTPTNKGRIKERWRRGEISRKDTELASGGGWITVGK